MVLFLPHQLLFFAYKLNILICPLASTVMKLDNHKSTKPLIQEYLTSNCKMSSFSSYNTNNLSIKNSMVEQKINASAKLTSSISINLLLLYLNSPPLETNRNEEIYFYSLVCRKHLLTGKRMRSHAQVEDECVTINQNPLLTVCIVAGRLQ